MGTYLIKRINKKKKLGVQSADMNLLWLFTVFQKHFKSKLNLYLPHPPSVLNSFEKTNAKWNTGTTLEKTIEAENDCVFKDVIPAELMVSKFSSPTIDWDKIMGKNLRGSSYWPNQTKQTVQNLVLDNEIEQETTEEKWIGLEEKTPKQRIYFFKEHKTGRKQKPGKLWKLQKLRKQTSLQDYAIEDK